jgi:hypothetical protein
MQKIFTDIMETLPQRVTDVGTVTLLCEPRLKYEMNSYRNRCFTTI